MPKQRWNRFLDLVALSPDALQARLGTARSDWDFVVFQQTPIVQTKDGLLLIDVTFLLERVTGGLYWPVHDMLKRQSKRARQDWTHAWGDMVEALVEDELSSM